jgi:hypothetical protein
MAEKNAVPVVSTTRQLALREPSQDFIKACLNLPRRDPKEVVTEISRVATVSAEMATRCIYCRPVGKKDGRQTFALGPSIRLTEIAANAMGRLWVSADCYETDKTVEAVAIAVDLVSICSFDGHCSKTIVYTRGDRAGKRMGDGVIESLKAAALSIATRNAILRSARSYIEECMDTIKQSIILGVAPGAKGLKEAWDRLVVEMGKDYGVTSDQMIEVARGYDSKQDGVVALIGIRNAIEDGLVEVSEVFGDVRQEIRPTRAVPQPAAKAEDTPSQQDPATRESDAKTQHVEHPTGSPADSAWVEAMVDLAKKAGIVPDHLCAIVKLATGGTGNALSDVSDERAQSIITDRLLAALDGGE